MRGKMRTKSPLVPRPKQNAGSAAKACARCSVTLNAAGNVGRWGAYVVKGVLVAPAAEYARVTDAAPGGMARVTVRRVVLLMQLRGCLFVAGNRCDEDAAATDVAAAAAAAMEYDSTHPVGESGVHSMVSRLQRCNSCIGQTHAQLPRTRDADIIDIISSSSSISVFAVASTATLHITALCCAILSVYASIGIVQSKWRGVVAIGISSVINVSVINHIEYGCMRAQQQQQQASGTRPAVAVERQGQGGDMSGGNSTLKPLRRRGRVRLCWR